MDYTFLSENYVLIIVIAVIVIMTIVGYIADKTNFGEKKEKTPKEILKHDLEHCMRIPMNDNIRALNLSNSVAIMVYEVLRQQNYPNLLFTEPFKGENYLSE